MIYKEDCILSERETLEAEQWKFNKCGSIDFNDLKKEFGKYLTEEDLK